MCDLEKVITYSCLFHKINDNFILIKIKIKTFHPFYIFANKKLTIKNRQASEYSKQHFSICT